MKHAAGVIAIAAALLVGGCQGGLSSAQTSATPTMDPLSTSDELASYKLGPGDKLRVITFGEKDLTGEFIVSELGRVSLPLIGDVQAGGLSVNSFNELVTEKLTNGYLRSPRVSVEVLNYRPFFILGEVAKPGGYPFSSGLTVTNAVATAGGFTYRANTHRVFVRGPRETQEHAVPLTGTMIIHPGETVRIPERFF